MTGRGPQSTELEELWRLIQEGPADLLGVPPLGEGEG